ncbi:hypothetical protein GALMADRAFT_145885 [Galerina marginata CBS 339.88]|uniref:Uncharacterized protein n=1 Tax=Galerina marginata (strain CBS 339.88) TaxID=685588 RepID=A0A067SMB5_GALM3|nr:hypothetical protein GALMADRAFT_145885 [Galerina marginata CBS 339.88]
MLRSSAILELLSFRLQASIPQVCALLAQPLSCSDTRKNADHRSFDPGEEREKEKDRQRIVPTTSENRRHQRTFAFPSRWIQATTFMQQFPSSPTPMTKSRSLYQRLSPTKSDRKAMASFLPVSSNHISHPRLTLQGQGYDGLSLSS